jgi:prepilin-type processing-associated H-X9-DG protein
MVASNMKQIDLALHQYHDAHKHWPPKHFVDPSGQPLLSWRVAILPFIEQQALYQQIKLDQPWDAPANALVASVAILTYTGGTGVPNKTRLRVPVFPGSAWDGTGPPKRVRDITDGTVDTIAVVYAPADAAVAWADPAEWIISPEDPMKDVFGDRDEVTVLFFDGSVRTFQRDEMDNQKLAALLTIAGGEVQP